MGSSSERERREYEDWHPALTEHTHLDTLVRRCERQEYLDTIVRPSDLDTIVRPSEYTHLDTLVRRCERQEYPDTIVQRLSTVGMFSPTHLDVVVLNMSPAEHAYFQQRDWIIPTYFEAEDAVTRRSCAAVVAEALSVSLTQALHEVLAADVEAALHSTVTVPAMPADTSLMEVLVSVPYEPAFKVAVGAEDCLGDVRGAIEDHLGRPVVLGAGPLHVPSLVALSLHRDDVNARDLFRKLGFMTLRVIETDQLVGGGAGDTWTPAELQRLWLFFEEYIRKEDRAPELMLLVVNLCDGTGPKLINFFKMAVDAYRQFEQQQQGAPPLQHEQPAPQQAREGGGQTILARPQADQPGAAAVDQLDGPRAVLSAPIAQNGVAKQTRRSSRIAGLKPATYLEPATDDAGSKKTSASRSKRQRDQVLADPEAQESEVSSVDKSSDGAEHEPDTSAAIIEQEEQQSEQVAQPVKQGAAQKASAKAISKQEAFQIITREVRSTVELVQRGSATATTLDLTVPG
jgi:hypothetical protein